MRTKTINNLIGCFFVLIFIVATCKAAQGSPLESHNETKFINVFILAGQSNMQGHARTLSLQKLLCSVDEFMIDGENCYSGLEPYDRIFNTITDYYRVPGKEDPQYNYDPILAGNASREILKLYNKRVFRGKLLKEKSKVKVFSIIYNRNKDDGSLSKPQIKLGNLKVGYGASGEKYGPELTMGHFLKKKFKKGDVLFIKLVQGGSDLYEQWRSPSMAGRLPPSSKPSLYPLLIDWVNTVTQDIKAYFPEYENYDVQVKLRGFVWFQGFNDQFQDEKANTYEANLHDLIFDLRNDLHQQNISFSLATDAGNSDRGMIIQQAYKNIISNVELLKYSETRDLSLYYHYDPAAHIVIGQRLGKKMWGLIKQQCRIDNDC